jgi:UDP-N-acetylmuramoyl-L-alanyl-D-glutamate--2,6-diaminopimelate ligase
VTGTNGKTSTTAFVAAALAAAAAPVARTTTLGSFLDDERLDVDFSYGGFLKTMRACLDRGGRYAAIELTSQALLAGFARVWPCEIGVFTNLTHDHLDAHDGPEHYLASKAQLFMSLPKTGAAVLNGCDRAAPLLKEVIPPGVRVLHYGVASRGPNLVDLDLAAESIEIGWDGTRIQLQPSSTLRGLPASLRIRAIGEIFAENALAALGASICAGVDAMQAATALSRAHPPPGRFAVLGDRPHVVVDYAHTPDALERTIRTARTLCEGKVTVVFGAGGQRDAAKRPRMGAAARGADGIVLTSDNPRGEDPAEIVAAIRDGLGSHDGVLVELDRERAIRMAVCDANDDDIVVIAGKGHEDYQVHGTERRPFCDADVARRAIQQRS